jgi:DnaJ-class molecular chaperone
MLRLVSKLKAYEMSTYQERKAERTRHYKKYVHGWKLVECTACSGSGYYDHNGSPKCSSCDGTGRMRVKPDDNHTT